MAAVPRRRAHRAGGDAPPRITDGGPQGSRLPGRGGRGAHGAASRLDIFALYRRRTGAALARLSAAGALPPDLDLGRFTAAPPPSCAPFDIVVDAALVYARPAAAPGRSPLALARAIAADLATAAESASVDVAGAGFVNVTLRPAAVMDAVASILRGSAPPADAGAGGRPEAATVRRHPSPDEARAIVWREQITALSMAAGRPISETGPRVALGRVVVRDRAAGDHDGSFAGVDAGAFRFAVALCRPGAALHLDPAALCGRSRDNPAFWIPYAHARFRGVLRRAAAAMPDLDLAPRALAEADLSRLTDPGEAALARLVVRHPHAIADAAAAAAAHRFVVHLRDVAAAVHSQWNRGKDQPQLRFVNEEERDLAKARLGLVTASTLVLRSGLGILGVTAPDEMC